jgi:GDPmannose 4,6-dehydratase
MSFQKKILIVGGTGQFGVYLAKFLSAKNYEIYISTRNLKSSKILKIKKILLNKKINYIKIDINNKKNILNNLDLIKPNFIFYFAGQSSVSKSFQKKKETLKSNFFGCKNFLNIILKLNLNTKFFNAASSEIFGESKYKLTINSQKKPANPYGLSKLKSFKLVQHYRKKFNLKLYNGIIFNCESYLRPKNFILPKICLSAIKAHKLNLINKKKLFEFGNIQVTRDWGWCEEYVKSIFYNLQKSPHDFIVATGKSYNIVELFDFAFSFFNLNWKNYVISNKKNFRKKEYKSIKVNNNFKQKLFFKPKIDGLMIVKKLINYYLKNKKNF